MATPPRRIALNGALQERRRQIAPAVLAASGNPAGIHAEGLEDLLLGEVADGRAEAALQRELQQDEAGVRIDMLPAGLVRSIGLPGLERFEEAGLRVACRRPRRMVVRQQKPRRMGCELTHGDAADIAARDKLRQVVRDGIVERHLALLHGQREQRCLERFAQRGDVEQRVGRYRPPLGQIGETAVEEQHPAVDADGDGYAAGAVRRQQAENLILDDSSHGLLGADMLREG